MESDFSDIREATHLEITSSGSSYSNEVLLNWDNLRSKIKSGNEVIFDFPDKTYPKTGFLTNISLKGLSCNTGAPLLWNLVKRMEGNGLWTNVANFQNDFHIFGHDLPVRGFAMTKPIETKNDEHVGVTISREDAYTIVKDLTLTLPHRKAFNLECIYRVGQKVTIMPGEVGDSWSTDDKRQVELLVNFLQCADTKHNLKQFINVLIKDDPIHKKKEEELLGTRGDVQAYRKNTELALARQHLSFESNGLIRLSAPFEQILLNRLDFIHAFKAVQLEKGEELGLKIETADKSDFVEDLELQANVSLNMLVLYVNA